MGSISFSDEEREELNWRILTTRQRLIHIVRGSKEDDDEDDDYDFPFKGLKLPEIPEIRVELPKYDPSSPGPKVYVRDDGTVDWDGALQDRAALQKFGTAVWARI